MRTLFLCLMFCLVGCDPAEEAVETQDAGEPEGEVGEPDAAVEDEPEAVPLPDPSTAYFYGPVIITSPDGATEFSRTFSLIRREVLPGEDRIVEEVFQDQEGRIERFLTEMTRNPGTDTFRAQDTDPQTFRGTLIYTGPEWAWTSWAYNLTFLDGSGTLGGGGSLSEEGIATEKIFSGPDGTPQARIVDTLAPIDAEAFEAQRTTPSPWAP